MEQEFQPKVKEIFPTLSEGGKELLILMSHASHMVQQGRLENREFIVDDKGERFRLPLNVRRSVFEDIVKLAPSKVEDLLRN